MPLSVPPLFSFVFEAGATHNPADATTYYFGVQPNSNPITASTGVAFPVIAPRNGNVVQAAVSMIVAGTLGSAGFNVTFTVRNKTAGTTETIGTAPANAVNNSVINNAMTLAVTAGDLLEIQVLTPTWTPTNPTSVFYSVTIIIQG